MTSQLARLDPTALAPIDKTAADWQRAALDWSLNIASERTRGAYLAAWQAFFGSWTVAPWEVTQGDLIAYKAALQTAPSPQTGKVLGQSSINQRLSALSSFFTFAQGRGLRPDNPVEGVKRDSVTPYGKATWLSPKRNEDRRLLAMVDDSTIQGKRDKAILLLALTAALRVGELASLTVGALRRQGASAFLTYRRKGGHIEEIPLAKEAAAALAVYLATRADVTGDSPLFVATDRGRKAAASIGRYGADEEKPLSSRAIRYLVGTYATHAFGPGHRIHPHSLRHTAAKVAEVQGRSFTDISRLLKHKSPAITTIYMQATSENDEETAEVMGNRYA